MNKSLIIFGIVNITSDSFSDGGRYLAPDAAIAQARKLMAEGADVIDLGPASSNPDAAPVSSDTEIARIAPVLDALKSRLARSGGRIGAGAEVASYALCAVLLVVCASALASGGFAPFIYFQF